MDEDFGEQRHGLEQASPYNLCYIMPLTDVKLWLHGHIQVRVQPVSHPPHAQPPNFHQAIVLINLIRGKRSSLLINFRFDGVH